MLINIKQTLHHLDNPFSVVPLAIYLDLNETPNISSSYTDQHCLGFGHWFYKILRMCVILKGDGQNNVNVKTSITVRG